MEEPGRLQSMGSLPVEHDWTASISLFTFTHWRRKWQLTPVFLPGESQGQRSLVGCHLWGLTELDTTEVSVKQQWLHNIQLKTSSRVLFLPASDAYVRSFLLSPLYFNKTLLHKSSERSSLVYGPGLNSSHPEAKNPGVLSFSNNLSLP